MLKREKRSENHLLLERKNHFLQVVTSLSKKKKKSGLQSSSCHRFHCKKGIPYSQALRLNRICSETNSFDKRCNDLERFLLETGCSSKLAQKQILRARKIPRNELLVKEKSQGNDSKLTFNVTYDPVFRHLKNQLKELHVILTVMNLLKKYLLKYQLLVSRTIRT